MKEIRQGEILNLWNLSPKSCWPYKIEISHIKDSAAASTGPTFRVTAPFWKMSCMLWNFNWHVVLYLHNHTTQIQKPRGSRRAVSWSSLKTHSQFFLSLWLWAPLIQRLLAPKRVKLSRGIAIVLLNQNLHHPPPFQASMKPHKQVWRGLKVLLRVTDHNRHRKESHAFIYSFNKESLLWAGTVQVLRTQQKTKMTKSCLHGPYISVRWGDSLVICEKVDYKCCGKTKTKMLRRKREEIPGRGSGYFYKISRYFWTEGDNSLG